MPALRRHPERVLDQVRRRLQQPVRVGYGARLIRAELQAGRDPMAEAGSDEAFGISLVATACKPRP